MARYDEKSPMPEAEVNPATPSARSGGGRSSPPPNFRERRGAPPSNEAEERERMPTTETTRTGTVGG